MSEYTAYREGYSDGFNDGIRYMQDLIQNQKDAEKRQAERFSKWREKFKTENESEVEE